MKIAIAQINCTVGDLAGNVTRILDFAARARAQSADILLTPELALCGYPPEDLLLRDDFYRDCDAAPQRGVYVCPRLGEAVAVSPVPPAVVAGLLLC